MDFGNKKLNMALLITFFVYAALPVYAERRTVKDDANWHERMAKTAVLEFELWDGNQISTYHKNNGALVDHTATGDSGLEWPKGSGKTAIFASGLWLAGMVQGGIRTAVAEFAREFQPGAYGENPNDSKYRIYRIYKAEIEGMKAGNSTAEFDLNNDGVSETINIPTKDYREWPADDGAPFIDVDGDGVYDYTVDFPDILGDQFHWYIMNDGGSTPHAGVFTTLPLHVEVQTSIFGFDRAPNDALGNTMFVRWVIINKGEETIDSMFVSIWHDADVGDANDDFVACDTTLSIGYTFNDGRDARYGVAAPVSGSDFFQGPLVDAPGDSALLLTWNVDLTGVDDLGNPISGYNQRKVYDKRMLPLTSFVKYINGDDERGDPETAEEAYRYMNGLIGINGNSYINPETGEPGVFVASGDPVAGTGWLDSDEHPSGDRRFLMSSGPFTMAPGDQQEIVGCLLVAAGPDALTSIRVFKYFDKFAQNAFDSNFDLCSPPAPKVTVSQLDKKIILSWEGNAEEVVDYTCLGYKFQGYNIYQGGSTVGPWKLLKTFDIIDDVKIITDETLDLKTGLLLSAPVQFGNDSGIKHFIEITDDAVRNSQLINNRKYYFTVTAYAYDKETAPVTVESAFKPLTAVPGLSGLGSDLDSEFSDVLTVSNESGISDAMFIPTVIDPYLLTNHTYEVQFAAVNDSTHMWYLIDIDEADTLVALENFPVSVDYYDKISLGGAIVPVGQEVSLTVTDGFILTSKNATFNAPTTYSGFETVTDDNDDTEIVFAGTYVGSPDGLWAGFIEGPPGLNPSGRPGANDLKLDLEFRFTETGSNATYFNASLTVIDTVHLPFELWTVEDDTQIDVAIYQSAGSKPIWGESATAGIFEFTKNFFVLPVYKDYSNPQSASDAYHYESDANLMGWMLAFDKDNTLFENGNVFQITFNNQIVPGEDVFTFVTSGKRESDAALLNSQMDAITVYPNPYFGSNWEENNPLDRKVYFTQLGVGTTTIRIFTLSGALVSKIEHTIISENDSDRRAIWDLRNRAGVPVASGMYLAHLDLRDSNGKSVGEKVLKLAIFQPEERLDIY
ncbi:MAG: T9SS type A sorting domain-containing protein [Candidatus Marinimicrobia bacterium]|nr:T9SS type A sorting domain-containing protein [Candidatus Neomarinimicrobiota bacterium]